MILLPCKDRGTSSNKQICFVPSTILAQNPSINIFDPANMLFCYWHAIFHPTQMFVSLVRPVKSLQFPVVLYLSRITVGGIASDTVERTAITAPLHSPSASTWFSTNKFLLGSGMITLVLAIFGVDHSQNFDKHNLSPLMLCHVLIFVSI